MICFFSLVQVIQGPSFLLKKQQQKKPQFLLDVKA